jgi:hypothetical protein
MSLKRVQELFEEMLRDHVEHEHDDGQSIVFAIGSEYWFQLLSTMTKVQIDELFDTMKFRRQLKLRGFL